MIRIMVRVMVRKENNMRVEVDFSQLMDNTINNMLLKMDAGNTKSNKITRTLIEFANRYGFYGTRAITFITDLCMTMENLHGLTQGGTDDEN